MGIWYQLRARFILVCTSKHDDFYGPCIANKTKIIQLWHGIPLKKIMYDAFTVQEKNIKGKLFTLLTPYNNHKNDYVTATSQLTQNILSKAFRVPKLRTIITGFPRNDVFLRPLASSKDNIYKCIYMPTHRGGLGADCEMFQKYDFDFKSVEQKLAQNNIELTLRMHPFNKPPKELIKLIEKSTLINLDYTPDIYETILNYDCLITDYSSIYFDFMLTDKPIIFAPFDLDSYKKNERALYFDFPDVTLKPYCLNWPTVIARLIDIKEQRITDDYKSEYQALKLKFHAKPDKKFTTYSKKLFEKLIKL